MTSPDINISQEDDLQSPFSPSNLGRLFLRPTTFFQSKLCWGEAPDLHVAIYLLGLAGASGRIDRILIRQDLGVTQSFPFPTLLESWASFWILIAFLGLVYGAFRWWFGGWWYRVRLDWSGATRPDPRLARFVYTYSGQVFALPGFAYLLVVTLVFPDYYAAWTSEELWSAVLVVFPLWAVVVSYRGVIARFDVRRTPAIVWFWVLPWILYLFALGIIGFFYGALEQL